MKHAALLAFSFFLFPFSLFALTNAELAKRQARSVHLSYEPFVPRAAAAMATGLVTESQTNSYFMILGWDCGYCGLQDSAHYGKILIFSVWDPVDPYDFKARPENVAEDIRAHVLYADQNVHVSRFGGEGTGAKTITDIGWKVGEPVQVRIEATACESNRTAFTCFVKKLDGASDWRRIATVSTLRHENRAQGLTFIHSFVEDFWRNGYSATLSRRAEFYDIATKGAGDAKWIYANRAYFSGDSTESNAVDGGKIGEHRFFLKTGGDTKNVTTPLFTVTPLAKP